MDLTSAAVGAAMLFYVNLVEGVNLKIDLNCGPAPITYNATTQVFTCGGLTMDVSECRPTSVTGLETGNPHIECSATGKFKLTCPGGMKQVSNSNLPTYACDEKPLPAPRGARIVIGDK